MFEELVRRFNGVEASQDCHRQDDVAVLAPDVDRPMVASYRLFGVHAVPQGA
ncbi:MAG TPA: hypothetical protein VIR54_32360 [Vicinamibacterales bacterium]